MFVKRIISKECTTPLMKILRISVVQYSNNSTIIEKEVNRYDGIHTQCWDVRGPMQALHSMNKIRVPFLQDHLAKLGRPPESIQILVVGCGGGILTEALMKAGFSVTGIDPASKLIDVAKDHNQSHNVAYYPVTIEEFSMRNGRKYDAVIASQVIQHICQLESFFEKCVHCVKPGGYICTSSMNKTILAWLYMILLGEIVFRKVPLGTYQYSGLVPPERVQKILENNGCRVETVQGAVYNLLNNSWACSNTTALHYAICAVKIK